MMKTKTFLLASLLVLGIGVAANAQTNDVQPSTVKLLPISQEGMLRLLVVNPHEKYVKVNFYDGKSLITEDNIKPFQYEKGFLRLYDFNKIKPGTYTLEVVSGDVKTAFELEVQKDQKVWAKYWDNFTATEKVLALR